MRNLSRLWRVAPARADGHAPTRLAAADPLRGCDITYGSFGPPPGRPGAPRLVSAAAGAAAPPPHGAPRTGSEAWQARLQQANVYEKVALAAPPFPDRPHVLGKGWGGTVKLVRHRPTGIYAALKKVLPKDVANAEREFALASRVDSVPFSLAAGQLELDHVVRNFAPRLAACGLPPEAIESFRAWLTEAGSLRSREEIEAHPLLAGLA